MKKRKACGHQTILRYMDPLFGYGWDAYPKAILMIMVDVVAQEHVELWMDILEELAPQESESDSWPPDWAIDQLVESPELRDEFSGRIIQLTMWGNGTHWKIAERLSPVMPPARWVSNLMRLKIEQATQDVWMESFSSVEDLEKEGLPEGNYFKCLEKLSLYYGMSLSPQNVIIALLDWIITCQLDYFNEMMNTCVQDEEFDQEVEQWPTSAAELIPKIVEDIERDFVAHIEQSLECGHLRVRQAIGLDKEQYRRNLEEALNLWLSQHPDFFAQINAKLERPGN